MRDHSPIRRHRLVAALVSAVAVVAMASCSSDPDPGEVVLVSHDSFEISDELQAAFEEETGLTLRILRGGDAVEALNQAILTVDNPQGDVFFGVDDVTVSRALDADLFEAYEAEGLDRVPEEFRIDADNRVTPVDHGAVCVNYDVDWFAGEGLAVPDSLEDLADPAYAGLLIVQNPASSTPGLNFLTATIAEFGEDGWLDYWERLRANDVLVTSGWSDAYYGRFSGGASEGDRPLVVSYGSSPPFEVPDEDPLPESGPTAVIESTCVRQIEFAGVLANADNPEGARRLLDFLITDAFQESVPLSMYVFPVVDVELPEIFERYAVIPADPYRLDGDLVEAERDRWIREWTDVVVR
ncbi:MAG: thiamine ABC transporter substrate-binding protein [Acidimicrobiales bacterium]